MVLDIVIVGGGIAGLMTAIGLNQYGHNVHVFERKAEDAVEGGAGISLQPNGTRILEAWGLIEEMKTIGHITGGMAYLRYKNGAPIARSETPGDGSQLYFRRTDFRQLLVRQVRQRGIPIFYKKAAADIDVNSPSISFSDGSTVKADLIIAADGVKSVIRQKLFPSSSIEIGADCTFTTTAPFSKVLDNELTKSLTQETSVQSWLGPGKCIVLCAVPYRQLVDMQFVTFDFDLPDDPHPDVWNEYYDSMDIVKERYTQFEPRVQALLDMADGCWKWRNSQTVPLSSWSSDNGKVLLLGESAHAIVPFAAQGAGMCLEDSAVVSELYSKATPETDLRRLAKLYENLRLFRMSKIRELANLNRSRLGYPDGPEQEARDQLLQKLLQQKEAGNIKPDPQAPVTSIECRKWFDDYDAVQETKQFLESS